MKKIKVVGGGCTNCHKLADMCKEIIKKHDIDAEIEHITDINKFAELGVFMTPGLIIDNQLILSGKLPNTAALEKWILNS